MQTPGTRTLKIDANNGSARSLTRVLLACGVASAPLFYVLAIIQIPIRTGFDIRHNMISSLSLGDLGWVQIANFMLTGLLALLCAIGMRRLPLSGRGGTWGPVFIGLYGIGMILAGIFHPDPSLGFPPGAPAGMPAAMSPQAVVHTFAFFTAFLSLIVACFVFIRRFASLGNRGWAIYCAATGVVAPLLIILGSSNPSWVGLIIAFAGLVAFGWVSMVAFKLLSEYPKNP